MVYPFSMKPGVFGKLWVLLLAGLVACGEEASDTPATVGSGGSGGSAAAGAAGEAGAAGAAGSAASCVAGKVEPCPCPGTTVSGTQTCLPSGEYGPCEGCPGGGGGTGGAGGSGPATAGFTCTSGQTIQPGLNQKWMAGGKERRFYADFPKDTSKPLAVVFLFHGYGDSASNFRNFGPSPDADPDFPFVLITPDDTGLQPFSTPQGLDWALFSGKAADENLEGAFFEEAVGCLGATSTVDPARIYAMGFSAGAILTNMLTSRYQGKLAATLAFSGAWFSDPEQTKNINTLGFAVDYSWDALAPSANGMMLLTHGGASDTFGAAGQQVIDFEDCAQKAKPFLLAAGRKFIDCTHTTGHKPHPQISKNLMVKYFKAHRAGEPSPYAGGKLPADFPDSCTLNEP